MDSKKKTITHKEYLDKYSNKEVSDETMTGFIDDYCLKVHKHLNKDRGTIQEAFAKYPDGVFSMSYNRTINDYSDALHCPPVGAIVFRENKVAICKKSEPGKPYINCAIQLNKGVEVEKISYDNILGRLTYNG